MANDLITNREAAIRAGAMFDSLNEELAKYQTGLKEATTAIEQRNIRIEGLERALDEAYVRIHQLENDRDLAVNERDEMRLIFSSVKMMLDNLAVPLEPPPAKRKRVNGKHKEEKCPGCGVEMSMTHKSKCPLFGGPDIATSETDSTISEATP